MFVRSCSAWLICAGLSGLVPDAAEAQSMLPPASQACGQCAVTAAAPLCTCTSFQPVVETRVRAEPAITVRQQPRIGYRTAAEITSVPVTTFRNVTVDEGQYQMVWVPRPVTRQIAETSIQPQRTYRSEPFVYTEPVAQWSTQFVPEQTVRYVPQTRMVLGVPVSAPASMAMGSPIQVQRPVTSAPSGSLAASGPIPDPAFAAADNLVERSWTRIPSRIATDRDSPALLPREPEYQVLPVQALVPGESVKAPSAAIVWQTPGARARR